MSELKRCTKCGALKSLEQFYKEKRSPNGLRSQCKSCFDQHVNAYLAALPAEVRKQRKEASRRRNPESAKSRNRMYRQRHPDKMEAWRKFYRASSRDKVLAHYAVARALRSGRLVRPDTCEICGRLGQVEAHHPDYTRHLDVEWLCRICHACRTKEVYANAG